jgi:hypothetical protein
MDRCYSRAFFRLDPIHNLSYMGAATFLSIKEVIPEVHFELICKLQGLVSFPSALFLLESVRWS